MVPVKGSTETRNTEIKDDAGSKKRKLPGKNNQTKKGV